MPDRKDAGLEKCRTEKTGKRKMKDREERTQQCAILLRTYIKSSVESESSTSYS